MEAIVQHAAAEHKSWLGGWSREDAKLETFFAFEAVLWAMHLARNSPVPDPVATAMYQCGHVPMFWVMIGLFTLGVVQYIGTYYREIWTRRICMGFTIAYWFFVMFSFWKFAPQFPGSFVIVAPVSFAFAQFLFLCRRRREECTSTTASP